MVRERQVSPGAYMPSVAVFDYTLTSPMCTTYRILTAMSMLVRSATIQLRVTPLIKAASERVLWGIGLNMSEAVELFLRRVIVDQKIPFELIALETTEIGILPESFSAGERVQLEAPTDISDAARPSRSASNTRAAKKEFKKFLGTLASGKKSTQKEPKNTA